VAIGWALERVGEILTGPQRRLLEPLLRSYPDSVSRQALAEAARLSAGHRHLQHLSRLAQFA
jgi:hypothetical protein